MGDGAAADGGATCRTGWLAELSTNLTVAAIRVALTTRLRDSLAGKSADVVVVVVDEGLVDGGGVVIAASGLESPARSAGARETESTVRAPAGVGAATWSELMSCGRRGLLASRYIDETDIRVLLAA